jgi:hypothetical protein
VSTDSRFLGISTYLLATCIRNLARTRGGTCTGSQFGPTASKGYETRLFQPASARVDMRADVSRREGAVGAERMAICLLNYLNWLDDIVALQG